MTKPTIPLSEYAARRRKILTALKKSVGLVFAGEASGDDFRAGLVAVVLEQVLLARIATQGARQRPLEAREVGATVVGVDIVRKGVHGVGIAIVPLDRDLCRDPVPLG